jgi:hypothetical protein
MAVGRGSARRCSAVDPDPAVACLDPETPGSSPHFASWETEQETGRGAVDLNCSVPGTAARITPAEPLSLRGSQKLAALGRLFVCGERRGTTDGRTNGGYNRGDEHHRGQHEY